MSKINRTEQEINRIEQGDGREEASQLLSSEQNRTEGELSESELESVAGGRGRPPRRAF